MEQIDMTHFSFVDTGQALPAGTRRSHSLTLLAPPLTVVAPTIAAASLAERVALARASHALLRATQEFLDHEGFIEAFGAPDDELAAALGKVYWSVGSQHLATLAGRMDGAPGDPLDLFERLLASIMQGLVNRARADLLALGVDVTMIKYLRLPLRRLPPGEGVWDDDCDEPVFAGSYGEGEGAWCRLLLPGVGCIASAGGDGRFSFDLQRVAQFALRPRFARLARPGLRGG